MTRSPPTPAHHLAGVVVVDHDGVLRELRLAAAADQRHQVGAVQHLHLHTTHTETISPGLGGYFDKYSKMSIFSSSSQQPATTLILPLPTLATLPTMASV